MARVAVTQSEQAPAGWYPDPGGSDQQRWWDGAAWTEQLRDAPTWVPEPPAGPKPATPWATASLVLGVLGVFALAIVTGLVARKKIRDSGGTLGGENMATAGIVLGIAWGVIGLVLLSLANSGAFDTENRDDFTGTKREVAVVVDRLERSLAENDGDTACAVLLTPAFARRLAAGPQRSCPAAVLDAVPDGAVQLDLDAHRITIRGTRADVLVDEGGDRQRWTLARDPDGRWRVDTIR